MSVNVDTMSPEALPAWTCACGQLNSGWATECGRCGESQSGKAAAIREPAPLPAVIEAESRKAMVLESAAMVCIVKNPQHQNTAVAVLRDIKSLLSDVEKARVKTKEPFLERCRLIDFTAKAFVGDEKLKGSLKAEYLRIDTEVGNYQQEELEKAREMERQRQAELRRIEEERIAELARIETENRRAEEARQAELKRIADEQAAKERELLRQQEEAARKVREAEQAAAALAAAAKNKEQCIAAEKARKEAEEKAAQAAEAKAKQDAEFAAQSAAAAEKEKAIEAERKAAEEAAAAERQRQQELAALKMEAVGPQVTAVQAKGQSSKEVYDFEVTDIWALLRAHPGFVKLEPIRSEILIAINKVGVTQIKGLRIFPVVKTQVRGTKTIDV